ncbi:hypothetical protein ACFOSV_16560 [Algoriphagus namhaensis]|uniref:Uncharacterized protein n=1 Tax=Algoriphagus namhaensis TaxID=915353 RepID=A0ABV8AVZ2_9BACT
MTAEILKIIQQLIFIIRAKGTNMTFQIETINNKASLKSVKN